MRAVLALLMLLVPGCVDQWRRLPYKGTTPSSGRESLPAGSDAQAALGAVVRELVWAGFPIEYRDPIGTVVLTDWVRVAVGSPWDSDGDGAPNAIMERKERVVVVLDDAELRMRVDCIEEIGPPVAPSDLTTWANCGDGRDAGHMRGVIGALKAGLAAASKQTARPH